MQEYTIMPAGENGPNWDSVPKTELTHRLWVKAEEISAWAQVCYDENYIYGRLTAKEAHILSRYEGQTDPVSADSCLEFFFTPDEHRERYFNVEINPKGTPYFGYGRLRGDRYRFVRKDLKQLLQIQTFTTEDGWGVTFAVPVKDLQIFAPQFVPAPGKEIWGNFFKVAEDSQTPHFITWSKIIWEKPDFHRPEFFGKLIFK